MNVKHIPYDITDSEHIIDLINYNFDQFFANSYGVPGTDGAGGPTGGVGATGATGVGGLLGATGSQGAAGGDGNLQWAADTTTLANIDVIIPKAIGAAPSTRATLSIGTIAQNTDDDDSQLNIDSYSSSTSDLLQTYSSHIQLTNPGSTTYFDMRLDVDRLDLSFNSLGNNNVLKFNTASGVTFEDNSANDIAIFDLGGSTIYENIEFQDSVNFNAGLTLTTGTPTTGYLIESTDISGTLGFVDPLTLGTSVQVGTVIPINQSYYTSANFHTNDNATPVYPGNSSSNYETKLGRGKTGTEYEGWYYCHGYTWSDTHELGGDGFATPDLCAREFRHTGTTWEDDDIVRVHGSQGGVLYDSNTSSNTFKVVESYRSEQRQGYMTYRTTSVMNHDQTKVQAVAMDYIMYLGRDDLTWRFTDVENVGYPGQFGYHKAPGNDTGDWSNSGVAFYGWEVYQDAQFMTGNINCCGDPVGAGNCINTIWSDTGGWSGLFNHFTHVPISLYRAHDMGIPGGATVANSMLSRCTGPLYMSPGRMAPTGYYRVPEDPSNSFNGINGYNHCMLDWNVRTMTLNLTFC